MPFVKNLARAHLKVRGYDMLMYVAADLQVGPAQAHVKVHGYDMQVHAQ